MEGSGSPARGLLEGGVSPLRLTRSRSLDARRAPLSEGRISALQLGRAAQRARSASKRARIDSAHAAAARAGEDENTNTSAFALGVGMPNRANPCATATAPRGVPYSPRSH